MKWEDQRQSDNVEDRRDGGGGDAPGGGGLRIGGRGVGLGTVAIALVAGWIFGINPLTILGVLGGGGGAPIEQSQPQAPGARPPAGDKQAQFVSVVLANTEDVWQAQFKRMGATYKAPTLTIFSGDRKSVV